MATVSASQAADSFPVYHALERRSAYVEYGSYTIASALSKDDIIEFCKLQNCLVIDGFLAGADIDTGTETLEIDVGTSADTDALLDSGVITGDAVTGYLPTHGGNACFRLPYNGVAINGPLTVTDETTIIGTVTAAANGGGTGLVWTQALCISSQAPV